MNNKCDHVWQTNLQHRYKGWKCKKCGKEIHNKELLLKDRVEKLQTENKRLREALGDTRIPLLLAGLKSPNVGTRDEATIGLANLDNPVVLPWLEEALEKEVGDVMKDNIRLVIAQLEETDLEGKETPPSSD